jgi:CRISPR-associated endonuclease/helicase Cas3
LCSVPIGKAKNARDILNQGWIWRGKESGWLSVRDAGIAPGMTILLPREAGGYDNAAGWTGNKDDKKHSSHYQPRDEHPDEEQLSCLANGWRTIAAHTADVASELTGLLRHLLAAAEDEETRNALTAAVPWHDIGKNHPGWQQSVVEALAKASISGKDAFRPFAKFSLSESPSLLENGQRLEGQALKKKIRELRNSFRPGIAHEVASALAFRQAEQKRLGPPRNTDLSSLLTEYVIMSHHGRVRKVLRDELPRFPDSDKDTNTVRGVAHGSAIQSVAINGNKLGCDALSTDCRRMGRDANEHESYTRGILRLLEHYGPFRLAFFEAVFRAADIRASIAASREHNA